MKSSFKISATWLATALLFCFAQTASAQWSGTNPITTGSNVGVGTTTPSARLHVKGDAINLKLESTSTTNLLGFHSGTSVKGILGTLSNANDMNFGTYTGNTTGKVHLVVGTTPTLTLIPGSTAGAIGKVGIGRQDPATTLHVMSTAAAVDSMPFRVQSGTSINRMEYWASGVNKGYTRVSGNEMDFGTSSGTSGKLNLVTGGTRRLTVLPTSGNIGINNNAPAYRLHVTGNRVRLSTDVQADRYIEMRTDGIGLDLSANNAHLYVQSNTGNTMLQRFAGGVGIRKDPGAGYSLDVMGKSRFDPSDVTGDFIIDDVKFFVGPVEFTEQALFPSDSYRGLIGKPTAPVHRVYASEIYRNAEYELSDRSIKKNIADITSPLSKILQLRGVSYEVMAEKLPGATPESIAASSLENQNRLGFIAQELKEVLPELVKFEPNMGLHAVNYQGVIPVLVEAMKEQQVEITEQRTLLAEKEFQIENLETRLARLEAMMLGQGTATAPTTQAVSVSARASQASNKIQTCFPNPAASSLTVTFESAASDGKRSVSLFDVAGKEMKNAAVQPGFSSCDLFVGDLPVGTYFVKFTANGVSGASVPVVIAR